jgi:hypothetical protein
MNRQQRVSRSLQACLLCRQESAACNINNRTYHGYTAAISLYEMIFLSRHHLVNNVGEDISQEAKNAWLVSKTAAVCLPYAYFVYKKNGNSNLESFRHF